MFFLLLGLVLLSNCVRLPFLHGAFQYTHSLASVFPNIVSQVGKRKGFKQEPLPELCEI